MPKIVQGMHFNIGGREVYEDRVKIAELVTRGKLNLSLAIVADGVGGEDRGERASQITIDTILRYIRESVDHDVPSLLTNAIRLANQQVYDEAQHEGYQGMATTVAIAAIHDEKMLYVANVGDSRVYLIRNKNLTQLTMDHTYATAMVRQGRMSREEAEKHPRAQAISRAIGIGPHVEVDIGFYVGTEDYDVANQRGYKGLPIHEGDSILVCSDGLVKRSPKTGEWLITDDEIISVVNTEEGDKASRTLVAFALGRAPDDNVSVALLQCVDPERIRRMNRRKMLIRGAAIMAIIGLMVALGFAITQLAGRLAETSSELSDIASTVTRSAFEETAYAQTVAAYTPTPIPATATARPTMVPGEIGAVFINGGRTPILLEELINSDTQPAEIAINHRSDLMDGNDGELYISPMTTLAISSVTDDRFSLSLSQESSIFIQTGRYTGGAQIRVEPSGMTLDIQGSCASVHFPDATNPQNMSVQCYTGMCRYTTSFGSNPVPFDAGERLLFDLTVLTALDLGPIPASEALADYALVAQLGINEKANICLLPYLPSSVTNTPAVEDTTTPDGTPGTPDITGTLAETGTPGTPTTPDGVTPSPEIVETPTP